MILSRLYSSTLVRGAFIYAFCDGVNKAVPFLLLPFITHYLTPYDYGIVTNFNVYIQILSVFCYSSTLGALPVMYYKLEKEELRKYASNMILLNSCVTFICLILSLLFSTVVDKVFELSVLFQLCALIIIWFGGITNINMAIWRCEERPIAFGVYQISQSILNSASTILFVIVLLLGWQGRIYSMLIATVVFGVFSILILYKRGYLEFSINKFYLIQLGLFAISVMPYALSFWLKSGVDKIMLTKMCGLTENGLYSVAITWGGIITLLISSFINAYGPFFYKKLTYFDKDKNGTMEEQKELVKLILCVVLLMFVCVLLAYLLAVFFIKLMYDSTYHDSLGFLPYVMISQYFQGCCVILAYFYYYTMKTKRLAFITVLWSSVQIGVNYLLISHLGMIGVAISSAIISFVTLLSMFYYAMKIYKLPWFTFMK